MEKTTHNKRKMILIGPSALGTGVAGFLGWNYWRNKKRASQEEDASGMQDTSSQFTTTPSIPSGNDDFPLKKGSRGSKVTQLQNALVKKLGANALPKYGVDGKFGNEVAAALVKAKLPTSIDQITFTKIVGTGLSGIIRQGEEIVTIGDCEVFQVKIGTPMRIPKHIVLGQKEFTHQGWIYFMPKNSATLFRVKKENVKSLAEFKNEKS